MSSIVMQADATTAILNGHVFTDFVDGDTIVITPVNPRTSHTRSNQSVNIQGRSDADVHDVVMRVPKHSDDDEFLKAQMQNPETVILNGSVKENYKKDGIDRISTVTLVSGSFTTQPTETKNNQDGNIMREYTMRFNKAIAA